MPTKPLPFRRLPGSAPAPIDPDEPERLTAAEGKTCSLVALGLCLALFSADGGGLLRTGLAQMAYGNRGVLASTDWLFEQRELTALAGHGPLVGEKPNPLHLPRLPARLGAAEAITDFAHQLKERGVPLLLVIVPGKAMVYPDRALGEVVDVVPEPLYHPDEADLVAKLTAAGVDVQDLTETMKEMRGQPLKYKYPLFLPTSSHWSPEAMQGFAQSLAQYIRKAHPAAAAPGALETTARVHDEHSYGDLVQRQSLSHPAWVYQPESVGLVSFAGTENDLSSPVLLMGDRAINVFDDPSLGFAPEGSSARQSAGFAQHLAFYLGRRLDTLAINGGGITAVRRELAKRYDDDLRAKKLVVWLVSAIDLISPDNGHEPWELVPMSQTKRPAEEIKPLLSR